MFILRRITSEGNERNERIGKSYHPVRKIENAEEYQKTFKTWLLGLEKDDEDIYGFVVYNEGQSIIPLYKKSVYFMMTESGKTFANLSLK